MYIKSVNLVYFSPNGSTKKTIQNIAKGFQVPVNEFDLTSFKSKYQILNFKEDELVIFAMPVFYGRLPAITKEFFRCVEGFKTPSVFVVVYGNRDYEDSLIEMQNLATEKGFVGIAGAAFIGEHSMRRTLAQNRPDEADKTEQISFGKTVFKKLQTIEDINEVVTLKVKGNYPYNAKGFDAPIAPITTDACTNCKKCSDGCPVLAINPEDPKETDKFRCIFCQYCVNICPANAKINDVEKFKTGLIVIEAMNSERKNPDLFFAVN